MCYQFCSFIPDYRLVRQIPGCSPTKEQLDSTGLDFISIQYDSQPSTFWFGRRLPTPFNIDLSGTISTTTGRATFGAGAGYQLSWQELASCVGCSNGHCVAGFCACFAGFSGTDCSQTVALEALVVGTDRSIVSSENSWTHYLLTPTAAETQTILLNVTSSTGSPTMCMTCGSVASACLAPDFVAEPNPRGAQLTLEDPQAFCASEFTISIWSGPNSYTATLSTTLGCIDCAGECLSGVCTCADDCFTDGNCGERTSPILLTL